jgi:hypothetical protein
MSIDPTQNEPTHAPIAHRVQGVLILIALTLCATLPLILSGNANGRGAADDYNYHWIAIQKFAIEWASPDLSNYHSATTPGYHLILAPLVHNGLGHLGAQLIAMGWTLAFFGMVCWVVTRSMGRWAALVCLPLVVSMYTLYPGVWLLPDNAGWFFVVSMMLLTMRDHSHWSIWVVSGVLLAALVMMRQIHIWAAGVVWLGAWLGAGQRVPIDLRSLFDDVVARSGRTLIAIACTIPAFALLGWFVMLWGGLVPPMFQSDHQGPNPATPGFILMQLGVMSLFFLPVLLPRWRELWAHHWRWVVLSALIGSACALVPVSSYSIDAGRYSGWWNFIERVPTIADRSPVYILGAILGSLALPAWLNLCSRRDTWIWVGTLIAFVLAQSANHASWQRYHEPMLLVMIILIIARSRALDHARVRVMVGVVLLSMLLGALTIAGLWTAEPYTPIENPLESLSQLD